MIQKADLVRGALASLSQVKVYDTTQTEDFSIQDPVKVLIKLNNASSINLYQHLLKLKSVECVDYPTSSKSIVVSIKATTTDEAVDCFLKIISDVSLMGDG